MEQTQHTSKEFDAELEHIRQRILAMGGLAEHQLVAGVEALLRSDAVLAERVMRDEAGVNDLEREIDGLCTNVIAIRTPAAVDLRFVLMAFKIITDLERIGDEAKKIALYAQKMSGKGRIQSSLLTDIRHMSGLVSDMLHDALDSFARLDAGAAPGNVRRDDEVDQQFQAVLRQLLTYMFEDPRTISLSLDVIFIAKALERVGDHAKNVSEHVIYLIKGKDVRHVSIEEMELAARS